MLQSAARHDDLTASFERLQLRSRSEPFPEKRTRQDRLERTIALLAQHRNEICDAISADYGTRSRTQSLIAEVFVTQQMLGFARRRVGRWMRPERRGTGFMGLPLSLLGARARVLHQPLGLVGVIGPWNFPVNLLLAPLAGIFAAGNVAMLKPSEHTPETAELMARLVAERFDPDELTVVTGGIEQARAFGRLPFDHLIYTGGECAARDVLHSAASNLTPVTLELGGKSPVVVSQGADLTMAARRTIGGKLLNNGQVCLAPDIVLIPREKLDSLILAMIAEAERMAPQPEINPDVAAVLNARHYDRMTELLDDARSRGARIVSAAKVPESTTSRRLPITLVVDPPDDSRIMREEIFGPLVAVKPYDRFEDAIASINARPRPLALYYFGRRKAEIDRLRRETVSGSLVLNDVVMQYTAEDLPFGGVGQSGMGRYHGRDGFRNFSNARAEYRQAFPDLGAIVRPPFTSVKARLFDLLTSRGYA